jgi:8-oxo-dGTP diphosphatase
VTRGGDRRIVVVAAVIERGGRVLVSQRMPDAGHGNRWEFPGGKRERGEGDRAALRRELREELGVELTVADRVWTSHAGPLELRFYRCPWRPALRPRAIGVAQFRWVRREDLPSLCFPPADDELVATLASGGLPPSGRRAGGRGPR